MVNRGGRAWLDCFRGEFSVPGGGAVFRGVRNKISVGYRIYFMSVLYSEDKFWLKSIL